MEGTAVDLGFVGETHTVKAKIIKKALDDGFIPVISPIACDEDGQVYNTNADTAAARCGCLAGTKASIPVRRSGLYGMSRIPVPSFRQSADSLDSLVADGTISSGMIPKTDSAVKALRNGVHRVHFIDGQQNHSLLLEIFTDEGVGTEIVNG